MSTTEGPPPSKGGLAHRLIRPAQVIIVSSVMFTFISYWRTAAVVLCDLASSAYYIGGIAEQAIGPAAPWFILAVMLFSYAVRSVYIESCTLFIRGGVYRVVKEALGRFMAKIAVSALMFDFCLTGPISAVSAGQYLIGLVLDTLILINPAWRIEDEVTREAVRRWASVLIACAITLYFFRLNLLGIHESSDKALKIVIATSIMGVIMVLWCALTLVVKPAPNPIPSPEPDLQRKVEYEVTIGRDRVTNEDRSMWQRDPDTGRLVPKKDAQGQPVPKINEVTQAQEDPLGFLDFLLPAKALRILRQPGSWLSLIGFLGIAIAFGHSILAMSGEETLAQVYREVESPKLPNFKKAAFVVFVYSFLFTGTISFLAVLLIPEEVRMKDYADNLIGGLAMYVWGPPLARLLLSAFVVVMGFLILAGAVNTAIIGSNGVLNRVAEDGVLTDWFLKPHRRYGTSYRLICLIVALQLCIILASRGHLLVLGEAYAFGLIWSFVFQAISMVVLRFRDRRPREFKVPFNIQIGSVQVPLGLSLIMFILVVTAIMNLLTKEVATVAGTAFTIAFFTIFWLSERFHEKRRRGNAHQHLEQFNQQATSKVTVSSLSLTKIYRKLVAIRSPHNLFMLEKALAETDPDTTAVVVMTAKVTPTAEGNLERLNLDLYDQQLMTAVVQRAEKAGKQVRPLIVPTNNPLYAVLQTARDLQAQELIIGASNKYTADEQQDQIALYWFNLHQGQPAPLTVRILSRDRDISFDLAGGNRIPKISERRARSVAELRAAGVGVDRVLLVHDGSPAGSDLFQAVLTMLDPEVALGVVPMLVSAQTDQADGSIIAKDQERAQHLDRSIHILAVEGENGAALVRLAREGQYDLIILGLPPEPPAGATSRIDARVQYVLEHAHCRVFLAAAPVIPAEVIDTSPGKDEG